MALGRGTQKQHAQMLGLLTDQLVYLRNFRIESRQTPHGF
jgi:hypothetical protein